MRSKVFRYRASLDLEDKVNNYISSSTGVLYLDRTLDESFSAYVLIGLNEKVGLISDPVLVSNLFPFSCIDKEAYFNYSYSYHCHGFWLKTKFYECFIRGERYYS